MRVFKSGDCSFETVAAAHIAMSHLPWSLLDVLTHLCTIGMPTASNILGFPGAGLVLDFASELVKGHWRYCAVETGKASERTSRL